MERVSEGFAADSKYELSSGRNDRHSEDFMARTLAPIRDLNHGRGASALPAFICFL
jgi:hypothetical protein